ncbi:MAG: hypothetical protein QGF31_05760 [Nitrospinota bacterium]|nr:hypothetical protein [Nitrospinota bacterium]
MDKMKSRQLKDNVKTLIKLAADEKLSYDEFKLLVEPLFEALEKKGYYIKDVEREGNIITVVYELK